MSETELGRLMNEVTAQPPVDVAYDAIADRVHRRQARARASAVVASVTALAVIIAVPAAMRSDRHPGVMSKPAPALPSAATVVDPSWVAQSWGAFHWRQPGEWKVVDTGLGNHSRPSNNGIEGPFLTTEKLRAGCYAAGPNTGACNRQHVLAHPLPADGVVVELVGSFSLGGLTGAVLPPDELGSITSPDATCKAWGGAKSFTASRTFGPPDAPNRLELVGCLGSAVAESASRDLQAVMGTVTDSNFNTVPTGPSQRVTNGHLSWLLPSTWSGTKGSAPRQLASWCQDDPKPGSGGSCDQPSGAAHLTNGGALAWISGIYDSAIPAKMDPTKEYANQPFGQSIAMTPECRAIGGAELFVVQRHLGPVSSGELVTVSGCLTDKDEASQQSELRGILNSVSDSQYPSGKDICSSVPAKVEAAALDTVGSIRILRWGTAQPARDAFPNAKPDEFAAWCWVRDDAHQQFVVYAAHQGDPAVKVVDVHAPTYWGTHPAPSAAPTSLIDSAIYHQSTPPPLGNLASAKTTRALSAADALCKAALPDYLTATLATVAEVRAATWGPIGIDGKGRLANAFPGAKGSDPAAWCWDGTKGYYDDYAVHAGQKVKAIGIVEDVNLPVPSGPPNVP